MDETTPAPTLTDMTRIGMYFRPGQFDIAKAAYLADWQAGGEANTFARWIAGALQEHAHRTPQQRADLAQTQERGPSSGNSRSFRVPTETTVTVRRSVIEDQAANRWTSESAWCNDAITTAAEQARQRAGGELPTPPARLPNKLIR